MRSKGGLGDGLPYGDSDARRRGSLAMTTMFGRLLQSVALRSAATKYASLLGPRLRQDYGGSEHYTAGQIRAAAAKCQLKMNHIAIGYAAFMPEAAFRDIVPHKDYHALRTLFDRYATTKAETAFSPVPENWYASGGGDLHSGSN